MTLLMMGHFVDDLLQVVADVHTTSESLRQMSDTPVNTDNISPAIDVAANILPAVDDVHVAGEPLLAITNTGIESSTKLQPTVQKTFVCVTFPH